MVCVAPGLALLWFRARGNEITMEPTFELTIWGMMLAGFGNAVWSLVRLMRGR